MSLEVDINSNFIFRLYVTSWKCLFRNGVNNKYIRNYTSISIYRVEYGRPPKRPLCEEELKCNTWIQCSLVDTHKTDYRLKVGPTNLEQNVDMGWERCLPYRKEILYHVSISMSKRLQQIEWWIQKTNQLAEIRNW